jgi:hypothetical protein
MVREVIDCSMQNRLGEIEGHMHDECGVPTVERTRKKNRDTSLVAASFV